jgi:hypothetical protein
VKYANVPFPPTCRPARQVELQNNGLDEDEEISNEGDGRFNLSSFLA